MKVKLVTPNKSIDIQDVEEIYLNTAVGQIGLLNAHVPYAGIIHPGILRLKVKGEGNTADLKEFKFKRGIIVVKRLENGDPREREVSVISPDPLDEVT